MARRGKRSTRLAKPTSQSFRQARFSVPRGSTTPPRQRVPVKVVKDFGRRRPSSPPVAVTRGRVGRRPPPTPIGIGRPRRRGDLVKLAVEPRFSRGGRRGDIRFGRPAVEPERVGFGRLGGRFGKGRTISTISTPTRSGGRLTVIRGTGGKQPDRSVIIRTGGKQPDRSQVGKFLGFGSTDRVSTQASPPTRASLIRSVEALKKLKATKAGAKAFKKIKSKRKGKARGTGSISLAGRARRGTLNQRGGTIRKIQASVGLTPRTRPSKAKKGRGRGRIAVPLGLGRRGVLNQRGGIVRKLKKQRGLTRVSKSSKRQSTGKARGRRVGRNLTPRQPRRIGKRLGADKGFGSDFSIFQVGQDRQEVVSQGSILSDTRRGRVALPTRTRRSRVALPTRRKRLPQRRQPEPFRQPRRAGSDFDIFRV